MWLKVWIIVIAVFTAIDYGLTHWGIRQGYLIEGNPLLVQIMASASGVVFLFGVMCVCLYVLYRAALRYEWVILVLWLILVVKSWVVGLHIYGLLM